MSLGSGAAGAICINILAFIVLVKNDVSLGADPAGGVGVRSETTLAGQQGRKEQGDLAAGLFVCLGVCGEGLSMKLGNKFGLILKYQLPGNCHQCN